MKHRVEASRDAFERSFDFPREANLEDVEAELKEGVLYIFIPKSEEKAEHQKINVQ